MVKQKVSFHLSLTSACNLSCKYCFKDLGYNTFSKEKAMKLIDRIFELYSPEEIETINLFSTSEPFVNRKVFWELYDYVVSKGLPAGSISFTTNGTILNLDEDLERMKERCYCLVSCDGTREQHNAMRVGSKDYYDTICSNVKRMSEAGVKCIASTVINADDVEIFDTGMALKEMGFDKISFKPVRKQNFTEDEISRMLEKVENFYKEMRDRIINKREFYWFHFFELAKRILPLLYCSLPYNCERNFPELLVLTLDGTLYKCDYDTSVSKENSVDNIFNENYNPQAIEDKYNNIVKNTPIDENCIETCSAISVCGGPARLCSKAYFPLECAIMKIRFKYLYDIANWLVLRSGLNSEELHFILSSDRPKFLSNSTDPEHLLNLDPLYYSKQTLGQIKNAAVGEMDNKKLEALV